MNTMITGATVITVDGKGTIHQPGAVVVRGDRITDIGPSAEVEARNPDVGKRIDGRGRIVMPGFVSVHNHLGYSVFRGRAEDIGHDAVLGLYVPMSTILTREERSLLAALSTAELLRGGVTTVLQMEEDADVSAAFVEEIGMRAALGIMASDIDVAALSQGRMVLDERIRAQQVEQSIGFAEQVHGRGNGRLTAVMAANTASTSSPELLRALRDAADRLNVPVSMHMGIGEAPDVRALHGGAGVFEFCRDNGFLDERAIAVHCYQLGEGDIDTLAQSGAALAHCPLMNQFRGAIAPAETMRENGVRVGLGIDNYFSDHFEVIRARIAVARIRANDPSVVPSMDALADATIRSAEVMGMADEIGSLEVGKKADLQIIDARRYGLAPLNDPVRTLVYHGHGKDIETVMIDGRTVVEDGRVTGIDEEDLILQAAQAGASAWDRFKTRHGAYVAAH
ncbi:amidohydrolase family protein [Hwanghaeella sp.]|uniref:amidohydrolase family protein n=1 Tax=Hwanghaeella sp. TaxID=2605943 RepID=UPI003CCC3A7A